MKKIFSVLLAVMFLSTANSLFAISADARGPYYMQGTTKTYLPKITFAGPYQGLFSYKGSFYDKYGKLVQKGVGGTGVFR